MWDLKPKTLYHWYRNYLSGYNEAKLERKWGAEKIEVIKKETGEIKSKPVYIAKSENMGENMTIDDKQIGQGTFTIMSNQQTGKIAFMVESVNVEELKKAVEYLDSSVLQVKSISCDMSPAYLCFCQDVFLHSEQVIDKFHVIKYLTFIQFLYTTKKSNNSCRIQIFCFSL